MIKVSLFLALVVRPAIPLQGDTSGQSLPYMVSILLQYLLCHWILVVLLALLPAAKAGVMSDKSRYAASFVLSLTLWLLLLRWLHQSHVSCIFTNLPLDLP
jgi:hypothetical protein